MYNFEYLKKMNTMQFRLLNKKMNEFNELNKNFLKEYQDVKGFKRFLLNRKVKLIKNRALYMGFVWTDSKKNDMYDINSMYMINNNYNIVKKALGRNRVYHYKCQKYRNNFDILEECGFSQYDGLYEMQLELKNVYALDESGVNFEPYKIGEHESIRCMIQNDVFKSPDRTPITVEEVYYDTMQSYFLKECSCFIKKNDRYVGYGQVSIENNMPVIVNFGVMSEFRGHGYGKKLLFHILNILKSKNFTKVILRVKCDNYRAFNLYSISGFKIIKKVCKFEIRT